MLGQSCCPKRSIVFSMEQRDLLPSPLYSCLASWHWAVAVTVAVARAVAVGVLVVRALAVARAVAVAVARAVAEVVGQG